MIITNKKTYFINSLEIISILILAQPVLACMPLTANDVFIARIDSSQPPIDSRNTYDVKMLQSTFPFRTIKTQFTYSIPLEWQSHFKVSDIHKNDLVIGLAYARDGQIPHSYTIATISLLNCKNDTLIIDKPLVSFISWNRENGNCRHNSYSDVDLLDGFIDHDQEYYLRKLKLKYPTCRALYS